MGFKKFRSYSGPPAKRRRMMPQSKTKRPVRRYRRRFRRPYRRMLSTRIGRPIPDKTLTKLMFSQTSIIDCSAHTNPMIGVNVIRANSIFNPDATGTGHQPLGRDQLAVLYGRYRVHGMRYKITLTGSSSKLTMCVLSVGRTSTPETNFNTAIERRGNRVMKVPSGLSHPITYTGFIRPGTPYGLTPSQMKDDEDFAAKIDADPVKVAFACFYGVTYDTVLVKMDYALECTYYVELMDKYRIAGS